MKKEFIPGLIVLMAYFFLLSDTYTPCYADTGIESPNMLGPWVSDQGDGTYKNPVLYADYSDPDIIRVNADYYMTSSSFNCTPGLQILHSNDLVNWTIIGKVFDNQVPVDSYSVPKPANGVWAPSIRYHNDTFCITYGDPDYGVYMAKAKNPTGPWSLRLIKSIKGWIDVCPYWDDSGNGYIVHAYAKSRIGYQSILTIRKLVGDTAVVDSMMVADGNTTDTALLKTIEGPKLYKRGDYYFVLAPAGGVTSGWQMAFRAKALSGPWTYRKVMEQGSSKVNGPHQGGWVTTPDEKESWFIHFQDNGAYGRVTHLQPMKWLDDWPVIGNDDDGDSIGNPVLSYSKPAVGATYSIATPATSDKFDEDSLGLQWQWYANSQPEWKSLTASKGNLRLYCVARPFDTTTDFKTLPNLLLQKFCADSFSFTTKMTIHPMNTGDRAGVIVVGGNCAFLSVLKKSDGLYLTSSSSDTGSGTKLSDSSIYLRIEVAGPSAVCTFKYSTNGTAYTKYGSTLTATKVKWIGAKIGLFSLKPYGSASTGYADFAWVNMDKYANGMTGVEKSFTGSKVAVADRLCVSSDSFTKKISVGFTLSKQTEIAADVYNVLGIKVAGSKVNLLGEGCHTITIGQGNMAKGVYCCVVSIGSTRIVKHLLVK